MLAKKKHLEIEFEKFMVVDGREDLKHWVERNRISLDEIKCCMKYKINVGDIQMEKGRMQIMNFMRDPYGNPYIPGSSIKGMLRTILLAADIMKNPLYYKQDVQKIKMELDGPIRNRNILQKNIGGIEEKAFHKLNEKPNPPAMLGRME